MQPQGGTVSPHETHVTPYMEENKKACLNGPKPTICLQQLSAYTNFQVVYMHNEMLSAGNSA